MALRTIQAPGIQVNEIDRSDYNNVIDKSLPNAPTCFIAGFADKGDDYTVYNVTTKEALIEKYGYPLNEAERYFYNGCLEILNRGSKLIAAKLPYDNNIKDKYCYVDYKIDPYVHEILTDKAISGKWKTINDIRDVLDSIILQTSIKEIIGYDVKDISTLPKMRSIVLTLLESLKFKSIMEGYAKLDLASDSTFTFVRHNLFRYASDIGGKETDKVLEYPGILNELIFEKQQDGTYALPTGEVKSDDPRIFKNKYETVIQHKFVNIPSDSDLIEYSTEELRELIRKIQLDVDEIFKTDENGTLIYSELANDFNRILNYARKQITVGGEYLLKYENFKQYFNNLDQWQNIKTVTILRDSIQRIISVMNEDYPYVDLKLNDSNITSYCSIVPDIDATTGQAKSGLISIDELDDYLTNNYTLIKNKIRIVDITRHQYEKTSFNSVKTKFYDTELASDENPELSSWIEYTNDCLGIVPVIVSPANALYFLNMIQDANNKDYNGINNFNCTIPTNKNVTVTLDKQSFLANSYMYLNNDSSDSPNKETLSRLVASYFPKMQYAEDGHYDQEHFKKIGIVVLSAYVDNANNGKINFAPLESFVGSLDKTARDITNNSSLFIDNIVNDYSNYIRCFSGVTNSKTIKEASIIAIKNQTATSLGFFVADCEKKITTSTSILTPIDRIFAKLNDTRTINIDLLIDAGLTNIGQYLQGVNKTYDTLIEFNSRPVYWWAIALRFDELAKSIRKDCIYLLDCPRPFCLEGDLKIIRRTKPTNTVLKNIVPKLKYITGMNSSYTAGYCNWFKITDSFSGDIFWCPPSIKAAGVYCYTDIYFHKWDAPAGLNRGIVRDVIDTAFNPTNEEAGYLYNQCWNYAVNYPVGGIVIEGQRTFLRKQTALDRINVRKLMLHLEKNTVNIVKYYLYEGHTAYLRQKLINALTPVFEDAINGYGISDYIIKCDDENNPTIAVERNELHCSIAVKPVKTVEFIVLNFIVTNLSANVSEEVIR